MGRTGKRHKFKDGRCEYCSEHFTPWASRFGVCAGDQCAGKQASAEPDTRTLQDVLRLHVRSTEAMRDMFRRIGPAQRIREQECVLDGLNLAIEVADNYFEKRRAVPAPVSALRERCEKLIAEFRKQERGSMVSVEHYAWKSAADWLAAALKETE